MSNTSKIPVTLDLSESSLCFLYIDDNKLKEFSLEFLKPKCNFYFDKWMDLHLVNGADYNTIRLEPSYGKDSKSLTCLVPIEFVNEKTIQEYTKTLQKKEPTPEENNKMELTLRLSNKDFNSSFELIKEKSKLYLKDGFYFNLSPQYNLYLHDKDSNCINCIATKNANGEFTFEIDECYLNEKTIKLGNLNNVNTFIMGEKVLFYEFADFKQIVDEITAALLSDEAFIKDNLANGGLNRLPVIDKDYCNQPVRKKEQLNFLAKVESDEFYMDVICNNNNMLNSRFIFVMLPNCDVIRLKCRD